jgi:hypothetical protein
VLFLIPIPNARLFTSTSPTPIPTRPIYTNSTTNIPHSRIDEMDAEERKAEKLARKAEGRQWTKQSQNLNYSHWNMSNGIVPEPLGIEPKGTKGALVVNIHRLQQELVEDARLRGEEGLANMKRELETRKLIDDLDNSYHEKYEAGLRKLRDDLRLAALADADEQIVDTLGETFRYLSGMLASASPEVRQKALESWPAEFGVALVDVREMAVEGEPPGKKKHPRDSSDNVDELQAKRNKSSENNDVTSDSDDEQVNGMEVEKTENGKDASPEKMNDDPSAKEKEKEKEKQEEENASSEKINDDPSTKKTEIKDDESSNKTKREPSAEDNKPNPANDSSNKFSDNAAIIAASSPAASTPEVHATTANESVHGAPKPLAELQQVPAHSIEKHPTSTSTTTTTTTTITATTTKKSVTTSTVEASTSSLPGTTSSSDSTLKEADTIL